MKDEEATTRAEAYLAGLNLAEEMPHPGPPRPISVPNDARRAPCRSANGPEKGSSPSSLSKHPQLHIWPSTPNTITPTHHQHSKHLQPSPSQTTTIFGHSQFRRMPPVVVASTKFDHVAASKSLPSPLHLQLQHEHLTVPLEHPLTPSPFEL